ncbi:MAG: hypothetical protein ACI9MC_002644 [Kiritimatiellia bacterium]|jgi:hypothetical protein
MADEDPNKNKTVKDLLRSGELEAPEHTGQRFGRELGDRHFRRPVGNSRRLWQRVDGEDPFDKPKPKKPPRQRGVYASGRFVRIDAEERRKDRASQADIPAWAREKRRSPSSTPKPPEQAAPEAASEPAGDPLAKLREIMSRRNMDHDAKKAKEADASARIKAAQAAVPKAPPKKVSYDNDGEIVRELPDRTAPPDDAQREISKNNRSSISRAGRVRTAKGGGITASPIRHVVQRPDDDVQHRYALGRKAPKKRGPASDLPIEMRRPPLIRPGDSAPEPPTGPVQHRYAAGRAPPKPRAAPTDIPIEMRRPPVIRPGESAPEPPRMPEAKQPRMAAGRAPPKPRAKPKDIPASMRRPPRFDVDGNIIPPSGDVRMVPTRAPKPAESDPPPTPASTEPKKVQRSIPKPGGGGAGMDDLFGAAQEGRVRIKRVKKKPLNEVDDDE